MSVVWTHVTSADHHGISIKDVEEEEWETIGDHRSYLLFYGEEEGLVEKTYHRIAGILKPNVGGQRILPYHIQWSELSVSSVREFWRWRQCQWPRGSTAGTLRRSWSVPRQPGALWGFPRSSQSWASFPPGSWGQVATGRAARGQGSVHPSSRGSAWWNSREGERYQPEYRVPSPTRWTPAERGLYQFNLRVPAAPVFRRGQAVQGIREHRGGGQPGGVSSDGALRLLEDGDRIQFPHRQESRPLDRLARCHWSQLGLSHRRPIHPALMHAVFYPPWSFPLMQGPQQQVFPEEYLPRRPRFPCYRY